MSIPLIRRLEASHSYGLLLGMILVALLFQASAPDTRWTRVVIVLLQAAILLLALWTSRTPERDFRVALAGVALALVATVILAASNSSETYRGGLIVTSGLMILIVPGVIAHGIWHDFRTHGGFTLQAAFGVLCIYLLLGMLFAFAFGAVAVLQSGPLFSNGTEGNLQDHLYFSFTTLTTVGYGDLAPRGHLSRGLSIFEALAGQLYLVTVVAVIVSNLRGSRR